MRVSNMPIAGGILLSCFGFDFLPVTGMNCKSLAFDFLGVVIFSFSFLGWFRILARWMAAVDWAGVIAGGFSEDSLSADSDILGCRFDFGILACDGRAVSVVVLVKGGKYRGSNGGARFDSLVLGSCRTCAG